MIANPPNQEWMRRKRRERGWVLISGAMVATLLVAFLGLTVDVAQIQQTRRQAQIAADAAAVAGAIECQRAPEKAMEAALRSASCNGYGTDAATEVEAFAPARTGHYANAERTVEVRMRRQVPAILMGIFGARVSEVTARSVARMYTAADGQVRVGVSE